MPECFLIDERDPEPVRATLCFDIDSKEGERRLRECLNAPNVRGVLTAYDGWLRMIEKHSNRDDVATLIEARRMLWSIARENDVNIWEDQDG